VCISVHKKNEKNVYFNFWYTYFLRAFFMNVHTSVAFTVIYCRYIFIMY